MRQQDKMIKTYTAHRFPATDIIVCVFLHACMSLQTILPLKR